MGYGQSKLVGEHIVTAAVSKAGARASILRIGQVVGDVKHGMWNDREATPAVVRSALTMGVLPELKTLCEWLPVDTLANCVLELGAIGSNNSTKGQALPNGLPLIERGVANKPDGGETTNLTTSAKGNTNEEDASAKSNAETERSHEEGRKLNLVYNVISPHTFSWTTDFLPALHAAGLHFETVSTETWLQRLRSLASTSASLPDKEAAAADPDQNPALKIIQYYESAFRKDEEGGERLRFEIENSMRDSGSLRKAPNIVECGLVTKMVEWWMGRWEGKGEGHREEGGNEEVKVTEVKKMNEGEGRGVGLEGDLDKGGKDERKGEGEVSDTEMLSRENEVCHEEKGKGKREGAVARKRGLGRGNQGEDQQYWCYGRGAYQ